jgi:hypothetical protein
MPTGTRIGEFRCEERLISLVGGGHRRILKGNDYRGEQNNQPQVIANAGFSTTLKRFSQTDRPRNNVLRSPAE